MTEYGYLAMYNGKEVEIRGTDITLLEARKQAIEQLQKMVHKRKVIKPWDVSIMLAEKDGEPVIHMPLF